MVPMLCVLFFSIAECGIKCALVKAKSPLRQFNVVIIMKIVFVSMIKLLVILNHFVSEICMTDAC